LQNLYNWQDHHRLNFAEMKPSEKTKEADAHTADDPPPARIKYYYVYRGQVVPNYSYKPLVVNNLVIEQNHLIAKLTNLTDAIVGQTRK